MRRRRFQKPVTTVSLFPFIAVLICTMGALIVLLVLVVQQARVQADTITTEREVQDTVSQEERKRLLQEQEDLDWQRSILEQQRAELNKKMAEERLRLSHLEEHIRRLEDKLRRVQEEAVELESLQSGDTEELSAQQAEIQRLQAEIQRERDALEAARDEAARKQKSFTIIAYRGPNGTRRRPIYIECRESGIILQPEGIVLNAADFSGPLGPGNPLDAALRTIREHWQHVEGEASKGEPYPLLVVRPDGATAYSMARAAMASWDDEFGYELVDADMELNFPPSDETLGHLLEGTVRTARQRQAMLAAAMPSRFEKRELTSYSIPDREHSRAGPMRSAPSGYGIGAGGSGERRGGYGSPSQEFGSSDTSQFQTAGPGEFGSQTEGSDGSPMHASENNAVDSGERLGDGDASSRTDGGAEGLSNRSATGGAANGAANGADGSTGNFATGQNAGNASCPAGGAGMQSMAIPKGENWALPKDVSGLTAITRPIAVECHPDRLVIRADRGDQRRPQVIPVSGATRDSVDAFVAGIQNHMKRWGMAVAGGHWKPVALVEVLPGAEDRFRDLVILLEDSGIQVEKR